MSSTSSSPSFASPAKWKDRSSARSVRRISREKPISTVHTVNLSPPPTVPSVTPAQGRRLSMAFFQRVHFAIRSSHASSIPTNTLSRKISPFRSGHCSPNPSSGHHFPSPTVSSRSRSTIGESSGEGSINPNTSRASSRIRSHRNFTSSKSHHPSSADISPSPNRDRRTKRHARKISRMPSCSIPRSRNISSEGSASGSSMMWRQPARPSAPAPPSSKKTERKKSTASPSRAESPTEKRYYTSITTGRTMGRRSVLRKRN